MRGGAADAAAGGPDDGRMASGRVASGASVSSRATGGRRAAGRASAWWSWWCWSAGGAGASCGASRRRSGHCCFGAALARCSGGSSSIAVDAGARRRCLLIDSRLRPPSIAGGAAANEHTFCRRDRCRRAAIAVVAAVSPRGTCSASSSRLSRGASAEPSCSQPSAHEVAAASVVGAAATATTAGGSGGQRSE